MLPVPADFAAPARRRRPAPAGWRRTASIDPARLARLRDRLAAEGVDAYFGVRREHMRWLTGFSLAEGEEKVAGHSGQFLVGRGRVSLLTDSRYTVQARREAPDAAVDEIGYDLPRPGPDLVAAVGARRVAVEAAAVSHALWERLAAAAPDVELVPVDGWIEAMRADEGAGRDRADRGGLCGRGPRAGRAPARDPGRGDGARPRAAGWSG